MKEPILSREEVEAIAHRICARYIHSENIHLCQYTFGITTLERFAQAYEAALLEKLCGEPIYQVWIEETSSYADVTAEYYAERLPSNRRIVYALNRSKA